MAISASTKWQSPGNGALAMMATMAAGKQPKSSELRELVSRRLKAARMAYDPNAAAVARALGISPQTLHKYENDKTFPDEMFIVKFCDLTGIPTDFIYRGRFPQEMPAVLAARIGVIDPALVPGERGVAGTAGQALEKIV
jgi:transcriptional regulator with XRE-family HTH domain